MSVPAAKNPLWKDLVTGKKSYALTFLAAKIMLGRLTRKVKEDPSATTVNAAVTELHTLFVNNATIESAKADLKTIFG